MKKIISLVWSDLDARYADDLVTTIHRLKSIILGPDKDENALRITTRFHCASDTIEVTMEYTDSELKDLPSTTALPS
jgi:hypothetical protein